MYQGTPKHQNQQIQVPKTPISQQRSYLSSIHQVQNRSKQQVSSFHHSQQAHMIPQNLQQQQQNQNVIWGTNISVATVMKQLKTFLEQFETQVNQIQQRIYLNRLQDYNLDLIQKNLFQIDGKHIKEWDHNLYYQLIYYPAEIICIFDKVVQNLYQQRYVDTIEPGQENQPQKQAKQAKMNKLMVSIKNLTQISLMRSLEEKHINRLISFRGIVIRCSQIYPQMKTAMFQCIRCKSQVPIQLIDAKVQQPKTCSHCKFKQTFQIVHKYCNFTDKQYVKIQQLPQYVPEGQTPTSMNVLCYDNNVNGMRPGDRVQIVGLYRCQGRKLNRTRNNLQSIFHTFTDLISFRILQQNRFKASLADCKTPFTEEEKQKFIKMAQSQNIIDELVQSFAGSIYGHQTIKKGLLTQIFGGTHKQFEGRGRFRSDINVCLVGDPSTAKSQLLKQVHSIAPRGIYTSGKSSSAVGLTANVRRDPQTRQFILESGALVLSDLGICCIDQFDKMDQNSKLILLEAMEQQTISIAKAGIVCQLNSRTSILSGANPINSKYDMRRSVVQNIHLPPALLSRFDLIYIILDVPNQKTDRKLAAHILSLYSGKSLAQLKKQPKISRDVMAKYITYAKQYFNPKITDTAAKKLTECYLQMRRAGSSNKTVSATPRQLQSLIRISQSFAKMKLSLQVTEQDVLMAFELIKDALKQSATDPSTGMIDMDVIVTGQTSSSRKRVQKLVQELKEHFKANPSEYLKKRIPFDKFQLLVTNIWKSPVDHENRPTQEQMRQSLFKLQKQGLINLFGNDKNRPMFQYLGAQNMA